MPSWEHVAPRTGIRAEAESRDEIEECGPDYRLARGQYAGGDHGGDRVRRVVEAVDEVEDECEGNQRQDCQQRRVHALPVFHDHTLEDVGDIVASVGRCFEKIKNFLPLDDGDRVVFLVEQLHDGILMDPVSLVLELADARR